MDLVAAIPLFAIRTLRIGRLPPRDLTYSSTVCASKEAEDEDEEVLSSVAAQRDVSILAVFDGLIETLSFWKKALLMESNTVLAGVIVLGVNADCWGAVVTSY